MTKEEKWMNLRCGRITASELGDITSASGKIIDTNLGFIRKKRWERKRGFALPVNAKQFDIGKETEPYIFHWAVENLPLLDSGLADIKFIYAQDCEELPIWIPEDFPIFGASPDAFSEDESIVLEFKTLVGNDTKCFYMDEGTDMTEKRADVFKSHGDQLLGQFLSNPKVQTIYLIKYAPQMDDVMQDTDSPDAPWRGVVFRFDREHYAESIKELKERIALFDAFINSGINPSKFKEGKWRLEGGELIQEVKK